MQIHAKKHNSGSNPLWCFGNLFCFGHTVVFFIHLLFLLSVFCWFVYDCILLWFFVLGFYLLGVLLCFLFLHGSFHLSNQMNWLDCNFGNLFCFGHPVVCFIHLLFLLFVFCLFVYDCILLWFFVLGFYLLCVLLSFCLSYSLLFVLFLQSNELGFIAIFVMCFVLEVLLSVCCCLFFP